jgi:hypothetical protein
VLLNTLFSSGDAFWKQLARRQYYEEENAMTGDFVTDRLMTGLRASLRTTVAAVLALGAGALPICAQALPVVPGAVGYGVDTPAGRGGTIYRVTNLNATGAGSLKACVDASGPRVCVFEVSGTIKLTQDLAVTNPRITIAGQTAPSPGIMIRGAALRISTSDVLVQHIRVRAGDDDVGPVMTNRDALKIESPPEKPISNIVIDHCSFSWAVDENAALWNAWNDVTLSNSIIGEGLHMSKLPDGKPGGYGLIVSPTQGRVTVKGNLLAHNRERNPLSRGAQLVFVNNVVYNTKSTFVDLQNEHGIATKSTVAGNVFLHGRDSTAAKSPITVRTDENLGLLSASRLYVQDNSADEQRVSDPWSVVTAYSGVLPSWLGAEAPPSWPAGLTLLPTGGGFVLNGVLKNAGARPADRDPVDSRIVTSVRDRTGQVINCVSADGSERCQKNAGGWPTYAQNRRTLSIPSSPAQVMPSGYTRLEEWLHDMSAQVEGRTNQRPTPPILSAL